MSIPKKIIRTKESLCKECFACVRACPVKAIKVAGGHAEVLDDKCIFCGLCVLACSQGAHEIESGLEAVLDLLQSKPAAAILAPEVAASFYPLSVSQVKAGLKQLGFVAVEDTTIAEEIVAEEYLKLCRESKKLPIIRSSCPVVVELLLKYYPQLVSYLAPIASPKLMQDKLVRAMYPETVATVCITPCPARKVEVQGQTREGTTDAVLTFAELKQLFAIAQIDPRASSEDFQAERMPFLTRTVSVAGGFPREIVASRTLMDKDVLVVRGISSLKKLMGAVLRGEVSPRFIDALACNGCVDGPAVDSDLSIFARKRVIEKAYQEQADRAAMRISYNDIYSSIPQIDRGRNFVSREVSLPYPSELELAGILASAEKNKKEEILNCGACGYGTCRDAAIAVYQGLTDWKSCPFFQRKLFLKVISGLKETAVTDGLTQLANRRHFSERLAVEFKRAGRYDSSLSLMMMDIDFFKLINDTYGHLKGDEVLRNIARIIKENVRETDLPARYGGDEFALILPEADKMQAYAVAEKLRKKVEEYIFSLEDLEDFAKLTISVGVATVTSDTMEVSQLVEKADQAMYRAKQDGRNKTYAADSSA